MKSWVPKAICGVSIRQVNDKLVNKVIILSLFKQEYSSAKIIIQLASNLINRNNYISQHHIFSHLQVSDNFKWMIVTPALQSEKNKHIYTDLQLRYRQLHEY